MSEETITNIQVTLREVGGVTLTGPEGKSLFLVLNRNLGIEKEGIMIAYEGGGAYFFELDRPLNRFRLVQHGFSYRVAPLIADLVNAILSKANNDTPVKRLSTAKDD